jgi:glycerol-3-phosphate dehydrogenase
MPIAEGHPYCKAEIIWSVREEMAMTVEDILARRSRLLFLDAAKAIAAALPVAQLMAGLLHENEDWIVHQVKSFHELASGYLAGNILSEI